MPLRLYRGSKANILCANDVWIGYDAVIRAIVHAGDRAIIGASAVDTNDVEPCSIVGGVPGKRFVNDLLLKSYRNFWKYNGKTDPLRKSEPLPLLSVL